MTKFFHHKYRIESARLEGWDYSTPWWYYITINIKDHVCRFGEVHNGKMILNELGKIVEHEWMKTADIRKNVELDYYVIMPNHIHGIIILNENNNCRDVARNVSTIKNKFSEISPKSNSLSAIIRSFKSAVTKNAHKNGYVSFQWQSRFYDRIIRNANELFRIRKYIEQNPLKWEIEKKRN
ncbi:MAG: transposase [Ignavibacteria bacterium]|nr:transposase [Ignavibacteria bacterium]